VEKEVVLLGMNKNILYIAGVLEVCTRPKYYLLHTQKYEYIKA